MDFTRKLYSDRFATLIFLMNEKATNFHCWKCKISDSQMEFGFTYKGINFWECSPLEYWELLQVKEVSIKDKPKTKIKEKNFFQVYRMIQKQTSVDNTISIIERNHKE